MLSHVNQFRSLSDSPECSLDHGFGASCKSYDCPVGSFAGVDVENLDLAFTAAFADGICNGVDDFRIAAFTEIRHAFYYFLHICFSVINVIQI